MPSNASNLIDATLTLCEAGAVLSTGSRSQAEVLDVLGVQLDAAGRIERLYLDRLIHTAKKDELPSWTVSGAISSVLRPKVGCADQLPHLAGPTNERVMTWPAFAAAAGLQAVVL